MHTTATTEYRDMTAPGGRHVLHLRVDRHHDHTAVTVIIPMDTSLDRAFPTQAETDAYLAFLTDQVSSNTPLWQIEHNAGVLTSTSAALDHIDVDLIAAVNEVMDQAAADTIAQRQQEQAAVADIVDGPRDGWRRMRAEIAVRQIRPTRTNVHTQMPTPAQLDRMRAHHNGVVTVDQGQPWTLLDAIVQRGHADPTSIVYWPGTQKIRSVRLNGRGWAAIGQQPEQVAV